MKYALLACIAIPFAISLILAQSGMEQIATLDAPSLREISGITRSSSPGVFWVHNDSGNEPRIFAITLDSMGAMSNDGIAHTMDGVKVENALNRDWEDVTYADGRLYVADMGNNLNTRRDLGVYVFDEPHNKKAKPSDRAEFLPIRYPDQTEFPGDKWEFDCEAMFIDAGKLYFLTKHRAAGHRFGFIDGTKLYSLDTLSTDSQNVLTLVGRRDDMGGATGADLSPDGRRLAVATYAAIWVFERPARGDNWLTGDASDLAVNPLMAGMIEGVTWQDNETLLVVSEQRKLLRVKLDAFTSANGKDSP